MHHELESRRGSVFPVGTAHYVVDGLGTGGIPTVVITEYDLPAVGDYPAIERNGVARSVRQAIFGW